MSEAALLAELAAAERRLAQLQTVVDAAKKQGCPYNHGAGDCGECAACLARELP